MMDFKDLVYYGMMEAEQASGAALFNIRWQRLVEIQNNLAERFVDTVSGELAEEDNKRLMSHVEAMLDWQNEINKHLDVAEDKHLSEYAMHLKNAAMLAIQFCQKYQIYDDIRSLEYHEGEQMIQLNGENLYYLG